MTWISIRSLVEISAVVVDIEPGVPICGNVPVSDDNNRLPVQQLFGAELKASFGKANPAFYEAKNRGRNEPQMRS
jgi:hypothetical protein